MKKKHLKNNEVKEDVVWLVTSEVCRFLFIGYWLYITSTLAEKYLWADIGVSLLDIPVYFQAVILLLFMDHTSYWVHRLSHYNSLLWKIHKVHHSATEITVLTSFRNSIWTFLVIFSIEGAIAGFLKVDTEIRFFVGYIFTFACLLQHSSLSFLSHRFIEKIFITNRNHSWHHALKPKFKYGQNFGFIVTFWDKLYKTHYLPDGWSKINGLENNDLPDSFIRKLFYPLFIRNK